MKKFIASLAILSLVLFAGRVNADEILIDTFSAGNLLQQFGAGTNTQTTNDASILGGTRDETLTVRNLGGVESFGLFNYVGEWNVAQGSQDEILGGLRYDGFNDVDFTDGGTNTRFALDVTSTDAASPLVGVMELVVESNGNVETVGFDLPANTSLPETVSIQFSDYTTIDFTQIDAIELNFDFDGEPGRDFRVDNLRAAVPEPTGAVVGLGLLGGFLLRRRRKA